MVAAVTNKTFYWSVVQTQNFNMLLGTQKNEFTITEHNVVTIENMLKLMKKVVKTLLFANNRWRQIGKDTKL